MKVKDSSLYVTKDDIYLFGKGEWHQSYEKLGAHAAIDDDGVEGYHFAVWAPNALSVSVVGEFNDWNDQINQMTRTLTGGIWETFIPEVSEGALYKYAVESAGGEMMLKADPYAFYAEIPAGTASRTADLTSHTWKDKKWLTARKKRDFLASPLNIFEVHLGSWKRHADGLDGNGPGGDTPETMGGSFLTYDELSVELVSYVKEMGYTHIELLPVMEHPYDGSWGYQVTGYFAPTSRYGTPQQFMHFIDACHEAGIGVILDWVPGGFCRDAHGLVRFDGEKLFEREEHPNWGTYKFDYGRGEVRSFLISNLLWWLGAYHADGIRMDGVTSMLYLNFGIDDPARKRFNEEGTEEDKQAIEFVRQCNVTAQTDHPDVLMIAEESTAWPLVTYPPSVGGLGFHLKWDMGWMNDTLHYCQTDFPFRPGNHRLLTFSTMYQFNENFVLPLSHDEVVHGKCSLITRMPGDWWRQFAGMRALALYQMTHSGAKLNFMGNEIAQFIEWRYYEGIQYFLTEEYQTHAGQQRFIAALNHFYASHPALWQHAYDELGFEWIDADNNNQSIVTFIRRGEKPKDDLVVLLNFDVAAHEDFRLGMPRAGQWSEVFNSDMEEYGGSGVVNTGKLTTEEEAWNGRDQSLVVRVPPLGGMILAYEGPLPKKTDKEKKVTSTTRRKATSASRRKPKKKK